MADIKIPSTVQLPVRPLSGARAEAIRNAQKAFFNAALAQPAAAKPPTPERQAVGPAGTTDATPQRLARPGSRLDIKV